MIWKQVLAICFAIWSCCCGYALEPTRGQIEFFESEIRPLLAEHCFECHSVRAKKLQAGLYLDSLTAMLRGGDSGAAVVPGKPDESLLMEAVRDAGYEMPPGGKLPSSAIKALETWITMGAPWPEESEPVPGVTPQAFDWQHRVREHWCWQPMVAVQPPPVADSHWPCNAIDQFILSRLEKEQLLPAEDADKRSWIRRVYFDLIGLPPTPEQVQGFLQDDADTAYANVVDTLLRSPHFGEKWARHWLDLVRDGETLGHEFDYPLRHAFRYRDYVIRAWNADVPYNQLVLEHVAGDLLKSPRLHPSEGFNESIIGTGFWFLGEACHAPTDVRADESDRIDNQIDVFSKTFLGLTVACARCHDHKFDPIPTQDYYALAGYLQSSRRQEALLDPHGRIHRARVKLDQLDQERTLAWREALPAVEIDVDALQGALNAFLDSKEEAAAAAEKTTHPLHALAQLRVAENFPEAREALRAKLHADEQQARASMQQTELFVDFGTADLASWYFTGEAFDDRPTQTGSLQMVGDPFARPRAIHSGRVARQLQGVLRSPTFVLNHQRIHYKVNGRNVRIRLIVDGYTMDEFNALLFQDMTVDVDTKGVTTWVSQVQDLYHYVGHRAHIEVIDRGDGFAALEQIRFSDEAMPHDIPHPMNIVVLAMRPEAPQSLLAGYVSAIVDSWKRFQRGAANDGDVEIANWLCRVSAVQVPAAVKRLEQDMLAIDSICN